MIHLFKPIVLEEHKMAIEKVLSSGRFILGEEVASFEKEFANYIGVKYGIGLNSGTSALIFSLKACDIGEGDEVITVPNSFVATSNAILSVGAKPVFVDIDEETYQIDTSLIEKSITKNTRAILPVHLYGHPCDMDPILEIAEKYGLLVVEDACQAHGTKYKGKRVGSFGDVACFSFYPSKNLGCFGDGGMVVTNSDEIAEKVRMLRDYGQKVKYRHEVLGFNDRLDELQAAVLMVSLRHLEEWIQKRRENAKYYNKLFEELNKDIITPSEKEWAFHTYYLYVIRTKMRDKLREFLSKKGVETGIHYPTPIHLQPFYVNQFNFKVGDFPVTERCAREILSLPMYPNLAKDEIESVVETIKEFLKNAKE